MSSLGTSPSLKVEAIPTGKDTIATELEDAEDLCRRGIIPVYSLLLPTCCRERKNFHQRLRSFFDTLNLGYFEIRCRHGLAIWDGFICHRCAYMQIECDVDRAPEWQAA